MQKGRHINKVFSAKRSSFEVSEWLVEFGTVRLRVVPVIVYRPTYSADHPALIQAHRDRRKAESRWRTSGLPSDLAVFKVKQTYVIHLMNEARCTYYKQCIDKNSKSLLNLLPDKSLPPHTNASVLANEMGEYFIHKIVAIRSQLAGDALPHAVSIECAPHGSSGSDDVVTLHQSFNLSLRRL